MPDYGSRAMVHSLIDDCDRQLLLALQLPEATSAHVQTNERHGPHVRTGAGD